MLRIERLLLLCAIPVIYGCAALSPTKSNVSYGEDLSVHRPDFEEEPDAETPQENTPEAPLDLTPQNDQTAEIDSRLAQIISQNRTSRTLSGFTIQVYSGTSRDQASAAKAKVYRIMPQARPETKYEQPIYKVRVGDYADRLAAQNSYAQLVKEFPDAIVIPYRIRVN